MEATNSLDARIASRHLLDHPFYQRWNAGELTRGELQEYARQYYHYALAFPTFVSGIHANCDDMVIRQSLLENLIEEERGPENHPELWLRFCEALGLTRDEVTAGSPNEATRELIATMRASTKDGALHEGLSALYAYESQIPAVAQSKLDGLAKWYGMSAERDVAFFQVHLEADVLHSATSKAALNALCADEAQRAEAEEAAGRTLNALYRFLDSVTVN